MRSLVVNGSEGWDLEIAERPTPIPRRGELLIEVRASGLVFGELDWSTTWVDPLGHSRTHPTPGREVAGRVRALGHGATGFAVGDRVFGWIEEGREGAFSEYVCARPEHLALMADLDWVDAAGLPYAGTAAWQALFEHGRAAARDSVAVVGSRTPVGRETLRIAAQSNLEVITSDSWRKPHRDGRLSRVRLVIDTVGGSALMGAVEQIGGRPRVVSTQEIPPGRDGLFFIPLVDRPRLNLLVNGRDPQQAMGIPSVVVPLDKAPTALPTLLESAVTKIIVTPRALRRSDT